MTRPVTLDALTEAEDEALLNWCWENTSGATAHPSLVREVERILAARAAGDLAKRVEASKIWRYLDEITDSEFSNRCLSCSHVKHNELGYCQVGECSCDFANTSGRIACNIRRDLRALLVPAPADGSET